MNFMRRVIFIVVTLSISNIALSNVCDRNIYDLPAIAEGYNHAKYAPTQFERKYEGGAFLASIDDSDDDDGDGKSDYLSTPVWVAAHIKSYHSPRSSGFAPGLKRPRPWYKLAVFDEERDFHQMKNKTIDDSYLGVGNVWNRGHLFSRSLGNRVSKYYGCNTNVFTNAVPQFAKFNQGIWFSLENYVAGLANQYEEVWEITGPIYEGKLDYIGSMKEIPVAVPDKLFKVIFFEQGINLGYLAFVYPNKLHKSGMPDSYKRGRCSVDKTYPHENYLVTLAEVEYLTGLTFLSNIDFDMTEYKNTKASSLPVIESEFKVGDC